MMNWINGLDPHWMWFALGMFLAAAEIAVPGVFLIWLAGAALVTGVIAWVTPIGSALQIIIFAVLSIVVLFLGKRYLRDNPIVEADPLMNRKGARLAGEVAVVTQAITNGSGRVKLGDSEWNVHGPDAGVGTSVRVTGSEGTVLLVEMLA